MSGTISDWTLPDRTHWTSGGKSSHHHGRCSNRIVATAPAMTARAMSATAVSAGSTVNGAKARRVGGGAAK